MRQTEPFLSAFSEVWVRLTIEPSRQPRRSRRLGLFFPGCLLCSASAWRTNITMGDMGGLCGSGDDEDEDKVNLVVI